MTSAAGHTQVDEAGVDFTPDDHVDLLFATTAGEGGCINVFATHGITGRKVTKWARDAGHAYRIALELTATGHNVWYGVARRTAPVPDGRRGTGDECCSLASVWLDLDTKGPGHKRTDLPDVDLAWQLLIDCPMLPSAIIHTGGGLHVYWLLRVPVDIRTAIKLLARVRGYWLSKAREHVIHIDSAWDVARVLRVPGTRNVKRELPAPLPVELVVWNPDVVYDLDDFLVLPEPPAGPPPAPPSPPRYALGDGTKWGLAKLTNVAREIATIPAGEGRRWHDVNAGLFTCYRSVAGGEISERAADSVLRAALDDVYPERTTADLDGMLAAAKKAGMSKPLTHDPLRGLVA